MREKKAKKVLEHVKHTYDNIAEEFSESRHYIGREFKPLLPYLKKAEYILDLGCGNGRFIGFLQQEKLSSRYLGIDNSSKLIKIAQEKYPKQQFLEGDLLSLPIDDESADCILSMRTFHHLPSQKTRQQALWEMQRVLKPKGIVIISVWNLWQLKYWNQLAAALLRSIFTLGSYAFNDTFIPWKKRQKRYYHAFTKRELRRILQKSGLSPIELKEIGKDFIIIAQK